MRVQPTGWMTAGVGAAEVGIALCPRPYAHAAEQKSADGVAAAQSAANAEADAYALVPADGPGVEAVSVRERVESRAALDRPLADVLWLRSAQRPATRYSEASAALWFWADCVEGSASGMGGRDGGWFTAPYASMHRYGYGLTAEEKRDPDRRALLRCSSAVVHSGLDPAATYGGERRTVPSAWRRSDLERLPPPNAEDGDAIGPVLD
jgi:hypothetical protein